MLYHHATCCHAPPPWLTCCPSSTAPSSAPCTPPWLAYLLPLLYGSLLGALHHHGRHDSLPYNWGGGVLCSGE